MKYIMPAHDPNNRECQKNICEMCEPQTHDPCTCPQQPAVEGWISEIEKRFAPNEDVAHDFDEVIDFIRSIITKAKEERDAHYKAILDKWTEDHVYDLKDAKEEERRVVIEEVRAWVDNNPAMGTTGKISDMDLLDFLSSLLPTGDKTTDHA